MFPKRRGPSPWFVRALLNLAAASLMYRLACGFQRHAQRQGAVKKYNAKG